MFDYIIDTALICVNIIWNKWWHQDVCTRKTLLVEVASGLVQQKSSIQRAPMSPNGRSRRRRLVGLPVERMNDGQHLPFIPVDGKSNRCKWCQQLGNAMLKQLEGAPPQGRETPAKITMRKVWNRVRQRQTRVMCRCCQVPLHTDSKNCFWLYHTHSTTDFSEPEFDWSENPSS